ncbi:hypothetical protein FB451DRAFT_277908 [Mycena latifolia]|nr:hypothetical protein FB451DRAFT_277908 [Mycena latifolia]
MQLSFWTFLKGQLFAPPPVVTADLAEKTVIVLGANTGIGFEAATHFAKMNAGRLILACRSQAKGQAAVDKLKATTGYQRAELWLIDLADFASVRNFADKFERDGGRLDILVENAAVGKSGYEPTKDGWDISLQVNDLSTSLLALLLLPRMLDTARTHATLPRIVVVSSGVHYWVELDKHLREDPAMLKTLGGTEHCSVPKNMEGRYPLTKLLNVLFVRALAARLPSSPPLIVNAVCPGYCYSELRRDFSGFRAVVHFFMERLLAFSAEQGSRQLVFGAVALPHRPEDLRGAYVSLSKVTEPSDFVLSEEGKRVQNRVWDEMVEILGDVDPRVTETVEKYLSPPA